MIQEAYDNYVHEVYRELYETLNEGTQEIRLNILGDAEVITNNGYIYHPYTDANVNGSIFFRGETVKNRHHPMSTVWFDAKDYPNLAKLVCEKVLPEVIEKENNYKIERLKANRTLR